MNDTPAQRRRVTYNIDQVETAIASLERLANYLSMTDPHGITAGWAQEIRDSLYWEDE